jgi:glucose-6-phosphate dehydrogenase assembly protein OpcA
MTATDFRPLGPVDTTVRRAQPTLDELWAGTNVETRAYTGNLVALTVRRHLARVQEALAGLEGRYAGRQIIGVMDGTDDVRVQVSLVPQRGGLYVERLTLDASPEQLQGAILPLLRPATVNHVWWGADTQPGGLLLSELTEIADQVIADSLTLDIPPARHYALADLGWSRSAGWREALAQVFDSPDAARQLPRVDRLSVRSAGARMVICAAWTSRGRAWALASARARAT